MLLLGLMAGLALAQPPAQDASPPPPPPHDTSGGRILNRADIKSLHRRAEAALASAQAVGALASLSGYTTSVTELPVVEEELRAFQNRDVLGGVLLAERYDYFRMILEGAVARSDWATRDAMRHIAARVPDSGEGFGVAIVNPLGFARSALVPVTPELGANRQSRFRITRSDGREVAYQIIRSRRGEALWILADDLPPFGCDTYRVVRLPDAEKYTPHENPPALDTVLCKAEPEGVRLENGLVRVLFDKQTGQLASVFDKRHNREVLQGGRPGNVLELHMEQPGADSLEVLGPIVEVLPLTGREDTTITDLAPTQGRVRMQWRHGQSLVEQVVVLTAGSARIDFETYLQWNERAADGKPAPILRAAFPLATKESCSAKCSVPWGDTTASCDAKERAAHAWFSVMGTGGGAALLNDGRAGHGIAPDGVLRISLVRTLHAPEPTYPPRGELLTYSLLPLGPEATNTDVTRAALDLNVPPVALRLSDGSKAEGARRTLAARFMPLVFVGLESAVASGFRQVAPGGGWVVELHELNGAETSGSVRAEFEVKGASSGNLFQQTGEVLRAGSTVDLSLGAYKAKTLRLEP